MVQITLTRYGAKIRGHTENKACTVLTLIYQLFEIFMVNLKIIKDFNQSDNRDNNNVHYLKTDDPKEIEIIHHNLKRIVDIYPKDIVLRS